MFIIERVFIKVWVLVTVARKIIRGVKRKWGFIRFITLSLFIIGWISGGFLRGGFILREMFRFG